MLNPSTADAVQNDPTIRRCINFSKSWGFGGVMVGNLFPFRATKPNDLLSEENPLGFKNGIQLKSMSEECELVICAWGNSSVVKKLQKRFPDYAPLKEVKGKLHCIALCKDGTPKHPLYLRNELKPMDKYFSFKPVQSSARAA